MIVQGMAVGRTGSVVHLVEDDDALRDGVSLLLEAWGWHVDAYPSAEAFLARYRPDASECLVLDVHLPGMNGVQLEEHLRAQGHDIPVILITAYAPDRLLGRIRAAGTLRMLTKPFSDDALLEAIEAAFGLPG